MTGKNVEKERYACEDIIKRNLKGLFEKDDIGYTPFKENKGLTVEALCFFCMQEILAGNGQKHIQISMDDEGNGYHTLFFGLCSDKEAIMAQDYHDEVSVSDIILLG